MCDCCSKIVSSETKHTLTACPVRAALYCSVCQIYGHSTFICPDKAAWTVRSPEFQEQLIPINIRKQYSIITTTPLTVKDVIEDQSIYPPVIEVPEDKDGKYIRATLTSFGMPTSTVKENKRVLEAYGALIGKKVVYLQNEQVCKEKQTKQTEKANKTKYKVKAVS
jgi:hypothetical protein